MSAPLLSITALTARYGAVEALRGVDLHVHQGEIVTLIGANGAGKSTLLTSICADPRAAAGHVLFDGQDITDQPTHQIMRSGIALSPEGRRIFPRMTVYENLLMGASSTTSAQSQADTLAQVHELFPRLAERASQRGGTLSGGEQQMLAIGRALMSRPRLLLLDEPSLGLAPLVVKQIFSAITRLNQSGMTILLVEQNAYQALRLAHRGYVLVNGAITLSGPADELLHHAEVRAAYLEGATR